MKSASPPANESARLAALRETGLLDSIPEEDFDDLTRIASVICGAPMALISLVDEHRQWFKSRVGLDATETPRDVAFCAHAILGREVFEVPDASLDERFVDNPLVTGAPVVRFYAGAPLTTSDGLALGTLCVIDHVPRMLDDAQRGALAALGRQVVSLIELRKVAKRALEEQAARKAAEEDARQFFAVSRDLLCVAGFDGRFTALNASWEHVLGFTIEELLETPHLSLVHPDDVEETQRALGELAGNRAIAGFENRYRCRDGSYRVLEWSAAPDPAGQKMYAAARDVTEARRERAERDRLAEIIDQTPDFVGTSELSGHVTYLNRAARELVGIPLDADLADVPVPRYHPEWANRRIFKEAVPTAIEKGSWHGESAMVDRTGREIPITETIIAHKGTDGAVEFLSGIGRDITHFKEVARLKSEFVSIVSHELRTPLTSIRGSLQILGSQIKGPLTDASLKLVHIAGTNTERLIRLINDILDIEKIEAGKLELRSATQPAATLVSAAIDSVRGMADQRSVILESSVEEVDLTADADRITQVLVNLLSNAVKFSAPGQKVSLSVAAHDGTIRFAVEDQGPGIAEADLTKLFGKFQQLDSSDSRARGGTGLGLSISKAIVEAHAGRIGVDSTVGKGSTFWFELPQGVIDVAIPTVATNAPLRKSPAVLLLEDDSVSLEVVTDFLIGEGFRVFSAKSIAESKEILLREQIDVLLLDLHVPDGDGLGLLEWTRKQSFPPIPAVVLSGRSSDGRSGVPLLVDWLEKPLEETRLREALNRAQRLSPSPRVLVIEDDPETRHLLEVQLAAEGLESASAADGAEALRIAGTFKPNLIILDVGLPRLDGFDVVSVLREGGHRCTPLIVYSGRDLDASHRSALTLGITRHITKAGSKELDLLSSVRELLGRALPSPPKG